MKSLLLTLLPVVCFMPTALGQLFSDTFSRTTLPPWIAQSGAWAVSGNVLRGGTNGAMSYSFASITNSFGNFSVQAQFRFPAGAYGGGLGGRFNSANGAHYAAWIYPENSGGGSSVLRLLRFDSYSSFVLLQQASLAGVGTNFHTIKLTFSGNVISVHFDDAPLMSVTDSTYGSGSISVDMWTDAAGYQMSVDNVVVNALPLVANDDAYGAVSGIPLIIAAPGVLGNDSGGNGPLSAVLVGSPEHGTLSLSTNGGFTYNANSSFTGTDSFTYLATDGKGNSEPAAVTIWVASLVPLYSDSFSRTDPAPWVAQSGAWAVADNVLRGGTNNSLSYGVAYLAEQWTNYSVQASIQFSGGAFGGGLDACLDPATGARYAAWIYPAGSAGGADTLRLIKFLNWTDWTPLQQASLTGVGTNIHTLKVACAGNQIAVYFDGVHKISVGGQTPNLAGAIGVDFWTDMTGYRMSVDDVLVASLANIDNYQIGQNSTLTVPAPGVLVNDTGVNGSSLTAVLASGPTNGVLSLNSDGGFVYTPSSNYVGLDSFSYQAYDGLVGLGTASVTITVAPDSSGTHVFGEDFDGVAAPGLPSGWSTETSGAQSAWVTRTTLVDSVPNSAFVPDPSNVGLSDLVSPSIALPVGQAQLRFRNNYRLEGDSQNPTNGFDGGVLEIKIGTSAFTDILAAGGSFVSGGYNRVIDARYSNPLAGRQAWSGNSSGFVTTLVNLPAAAGGQSVQLRWRCGTDGGTSGTGWYVDTISITSNAPKLPAQADRVVPELTTLTVINTASHPASPPKVLTYWLQVAPTNATISTNGIITWTPTEAQGPGVFTFTTIVSDDALPPATATNTFTVTVDEVNSTPVLGLPSSQAISELAAWSANATAVDIDDPANTLTFELVSGPAGLTVDAGGLMQWTPAEHQGPSTNLVIVRVFDDGPGTLSATNSFTLAINEVNSAPVMGSLTDQAIGETMAWSVNAVATDADLPSNILTFEVVSGPDGLTVGADGWIRWTPSEAQGPSTNPVIVRVFDNGVPSLSVTNSFILIVNEGNSAPVLTVPWNQAINELAAWNANAGATDGDLPPNTLTFELVSGPSGLTVSSSGFITWTPAEDQGPTTNTVSVRVYDDGAPSLSVTNSFTLTVREVNSAPLLALPTDQTILELATWSANVTATDADLPPNILTYELVSGPTGLTISSQGFVNWMPLEGQGPSTNPVTVRVYDNGTPRYSATNRFILAVAEVNTAPMLTLPADRTISKLVPWSAKATTIDIDEPSNVLIFELVSGPSGLTVAPDGLISWTPAEDQGPSTNTIAVRVYDNGVPSLDANSTFNLIVGDVNTAPVLTLPPDQTINERVAWSANATAADADKPTNHLTFELVSGPSGLTVAPDGLMSWTPAEEQGPSTNTVNVRVFDDAPTSLCSTNSFVLSVDEVNESPMLALPLNPVIGELATWRANATATDADVPPNALTFELLSGPSGLTVGGDGLISWTPHELQGPSTNPVTVRVYDSGAPSLSATNSFMVLVNEMNSPPELPVQEDRATNELTTLIITNAASDHDFPAQTLSYSLLNAPTNAMISAEGLITWTPNEAQGPGKLRLHHTRGGQRRAAVERYEHFQCCSERIKQCARLARPVGCDD